MKEKMDSKPDRLWLEVYRESAFQRMLSWQGGPAHAGEMQAQLAAKSDLWN